MAGTDMSHPESLIETILMHASSGTSVEPISTPHDMLMKRAGAWILMFHGVAFLNSQQQTGPRGGDKVFWDELVHADGATLARSGHIHWSRDVEP
jgi:hypothetical protein